MARIGTALFLFLTAMAVGGQNLPSVDVETANLQIEQFEQENQSIRDQATLLRESIVNLEEEITVWTSWVAAVARVSDLLSDQADTLIEILAGIGSRSIVERVQSALGQYERVSLLLESKQEELTNRIAGANDLVASNRRTLEVYDQREEQNSQNIVLLRAAIENSTTSESLIEGYLDGITTTLERAIQLLTDPDSVAADSDAD